MGMFDGGQAMPDAPAAPLDPTTSKSIDDYANYSKTPASELAASKMAGVHDVAHSMMGSPDQYANQANALGMGGEGMHTALQNRYNQQVDAEVNKLGVASSYESQLERAQRMAKAQNYLMARQGVQNQAYANQMKAWVANNQARNSVIGSVLNIIPSIAMAAL